MPQPDARITRASAARFARSFWLPPRAHGERIEGREVSFLELFYDLVYVVVVSQASHHLAVDVSWSAAGQFAVVFGLVWIAWINGASYHDLHGRSDGRTRTYVFAQMGLDSKRLILEQRSRNTYENILFAREIARPRPGEVWLLATTASHMPRAMGVARKLGWVMQPWPTDYMTTPSGISGYFQYPVNLARIDMAMHEWLGLLVYWLDGKSSEP